MEFAGGGREDFLHVFGGFGPAGWWEAFGVCTGDHWGYLLVVLSFVFLFFFFSFLFGIVSAHEKLRLRHPLLLLLDSLPSTLSAPLRRVNTQADSRRVRYSVSGWDRFRGVRRSMQVGRDRAMSSSGRHLGYRCDSLILLMLLGLRLCRRVLFGSLPRSGLEVR